MNIPFEQLPIAWIIALPVGIGITIAVFLYSTKDMGKAESHNGIGKQT